MYLIYDNNGKLKSYIWNKEYLSLTGLENVFEIDEVGENKELISDIQLSISLKEDRYSIVNNELILNNNPIVPIEDLDKQELRNEYNASITRLTQIVTATKPVTFTQVELGQMFDAIQDMARIERFILKTIAKPYL